MNDSAGTFEAQHPRLFGLALFAVIVPEIAGDRIAALRIIANPDKLTFAARQAESLSHSADLSGLLLVTRDG